jgi:tRNA-splicing ligase RtcB
MWTHGVPVDEQSKQQPLNTASMPFVYKWLAVTASFLGSNPG